VPNVACVHDKHDVLCDVRRHIGDALNTAGDGEQGDSHIDRCGALFHVGHERFEVRAVESIDNVIVLDHAAREVGVQADKPSKGPTSTSIPIRRTG
jgi:hypothetical protein